MLYLTDLNVNIRIIKQSILTSSFKKKINHSRSNLKLSQTYLK